MPDSVLVGDIGGTNARFAIAKRDLAGQIQISNVVILLGDEYPSFNAALLEYLARIGADRPCQALLAGAGPVQGDKIALVNRNWVIDRAEIEAECDFKRVRVVNDYSAMARAIPEMPDDSFRSLHKGQAPDTRMPILVAGPGTGLGIATLLPKGEAGWDVLPGEGGYAAYAPRTQREWNLAEELRRTHGFVSNELVLAGIGLEAVHRALCRIDGIAWVAKQPSEIMALAKAGDPICKDICNIRSAATLDALGDAALINGTLGGVVITGGVAVRIADWLAAPASLARFQERGHKRDYMTNIPIRLLLSGEAALIGAAALHFEQELAQ